MVRFLFYGRDHHECVCDNSTGHTHRSHRLDRHRNACRDRHQCHEKKNRTIMLGATNIPLLNADIVTGISMMLLFVKFMNLGFVTVLIAHITFDVPYVILNVLPKLNQTNRYTYEAALDLGATPMYAFYKVTWPEIKSGVFSGFLMAVTMSLDDFSITFFTKGAGVNTLSTMLYTELRKGVRPELYALSTILFLFAFLLLLVMNCRSDRIAGNHAGIH